MMEDEDEHAGTKLGRKKTQLVFHHIYICPFNQKEIENLRSSSHMPHDLFIRWKKDVQERSLAHW
jgi:hypothetical protein